MKQREGNHWYIRKKYAKRIIKNLCPMCLKPKTKWKRRTDWRCCSKKCTELFGKKAVVILDWTSLRLKVFRRDDFTCVKCGFKARRENRYYSDDGKDYLNKKYIVYKDLGDMIVLVGNERQLIADHIIPIALGGDEWDIKNIQTLCFKCNKIKTKEDAKKIAKQRRIEKKLIKGQKQL